MKKQITMGLTALAIAGFSTQALANAITAWLGGSAMINLDGTAVTSAVTVSGNTASTTVAANLACWDTTFTITDNGATFGLN